MTKSKWWHPPRWFWFLALTYVSGIVVFALLRFVFLLANPGAIDEVSIGELTTAFAIGVRFDQIVVLLLLIPLGVTLPWLGNNYRATRIPLAIYMAAITMFVLFSTAADIRFYHYMDSHLNFLALEYLGEGSMAGNLMTSDPWFWPAILISLSSSIVAGFLAYRLVALMLVDPKHSRNWTATVLYFALTAFVTFLGIRGRTSLSPIDWGAAYFSDNHFVNQLALNGIYTFGRNLLETNQDPRLSYVSDSERFPFVEFSIGLGDVQSMLESPKEKWLEPDSSLLRQVTQKQTRDYYPNVVLVIMESWSGRLTGTLGDSRNLTPHFDSLANHGMLFTNFYASGPRTGYGLGAILCSFPAIPGRSITNRYDADHPFITLPELLSSRGYYNAFVYGGDLVFDNVEGFFTEKGMHRFIGQDDFASEQLFSKWGVPDHTLLSRVASLTDSLTRPFSITALTLSNHEPFDLPDSSSQRYLNDSDTCKQFNAQIYADRSIGNFITAIKQLPVYDSTIFVFTSDHARIFPRKIMVDPDMYHIPLLIIDGHSDSIGRRLDIVGGQTDIIPTLMGVLGGEYHHESWGRDLLSTDSNDTPFAVLNLRPWVGIIQDGFCYAELPQRDSMLYDMSNLAAAQDVKADYPEIFTRLQRTCRIYVQIAEQKSTPIGRR